jgi:hypothetical protein
LRKTMLATPTMRKPNPQMIGPMSSLITYK